MSKKDNTDNDNDDEDDDDGLINEPRLRASCNSAYNIIRRVRYYKNQFLIRPTVRMRHAFSFPLFFAN